MPAVLPAVEAAYERAMIAEVAALCRHIPHRDLCIQWDVCNEMVVWDGQASDAVPADVPREKLIERMQRLCAAVPDDVELGLHLCYGDFGAKHFVEPKDAAKMVEFANALAKSIPHKLAYIHMPVPIERSDDVFHAPFRDLKLGEGTELFLGLVHAKDGVEGTRARLAAAQRHAPKFGIATECGMARARSEGHGARAPENPRRHAVRRRGLMARNVHLVGSVPMADAAEVFETVSAALGPRIKRLPDGETGERGDWITWLEPAFANNPAFEKSGEFFRVHASGTGRERYALKPGSRAEDVRFDNLFYADIAKASYADFKRLKAAGKIAAGTKFQVDLVPAHSVIWLFLVDALHAPLDPLYNDAVKREIDKIAAAIPHDELAIQFDVASAVFARLERNEASSYGRSKAEMQETFSAIVADLGNRVPAGVDLLYHLCYGDSNHRHVVEPTDMGDMVEFANRLTRTIKRPIDLIHMPVPRNRADDAYFEPLKRLALRPETELCLGLVHYTDGVDGTKQRLATAKKFAKNSPSRRNAVSAGATRARFLSCCASMPKPPTCDVARSTAYRRSMRAARSRRPPSFEARIASFG